MTKTAYCIRRKDTEEFFFIINPNSLNRRRTDWRATEATFFINREDARQWQEWIGSASGIIQTEIVLATTSNDGQFTIPSSKGE